MAAHQVSEIRNVLLAGHTGAGKTTLAEALLHKAGVTTRMGSVDDGTSHLDYDEESRERKHSLDSSLFFFEHQGVLINAIDSPGMPDHCGPALAALMAVDLAAIVVSAASGIGVNTRRMFSAAKEAHLPRMIVVNRIDAENVDLAEIFQSIRDTFGPECHAINLPADHGKRVINVFREKAGKADILDVATCHNELIDCIVETDDELMTEYMETGSVPDEHLVPTIANAVEIGHLIPVLFTNARGECGIDELLDALLHFTPSPAIATKRKLVTGEGAERSEVEIEPKPDGDFVAQVFKVTSDPKSNIKYCVARVLSGGLKPDGTLFPAGDRKGQRPGHIFKLRGADHIEVPAAECGDLVAFAKLDLHVGQALFSHASDATIPQPKYPTPMFALAIEPKARGDVEKISGALHRFTEEDPCFRYHRDSDTGELLIEGLGDHHLNVVRSRMKRYYKLDVDTHPPRIPYRETITSKVEYVDYTHKKQTGGAGQYARVVIDMEPAERGADLVWEDKIFGGVISQQFRPSVQKGVREQMKKGVLAGYPIVDVKVALVDGKEHPVDSKDIAFQVAGRQVFKKAFMACRPILLEPVVTMEVTVPADKVGEVTRDLSGKRGQILGQDMLPGQSALVKASVPLSEVSNYSSQLKSVTGGQGSYVMEFSHYDIVPPNVQQQIVASAKKVADEDEE